MPRTMIRRLFPAFLLSLALASASGEAYFWDLYSPSFMAAGAGTAYLESPAADALNPAAAAGRERSVVDASYFGIPALGSQSGWGNAFNLGLSVPTRYGVFSGSGRFVGASFSGFDPGYLGAVSFSFAKQLYPSLAMGAGLGVQAGSDWGLGLSLGLVHTVGELGFLEDFRWGLSLRDMGKWYGSPGGTSVPPAFTPAVGAWFRLVRAGDFNLYLNPDLSFPTIQDGRLLVGLQADFGRVFFLGLGLRLDLRDMLDGKAPTVPVSLGLSYRFNTDIKERIELFDISERGWNRSEVKTTLAAGPVANGVYAFGLGVNIPLGVADDQAPAVTAVFGEKKYISPNNDGTQDGIALPISVSDNRYVMGYALSVVDERGNLVRTIQNKERRPENDDFSSFADRLSYVKKGVDIPDSLRWDGTSDSGTRVPDGNYKLFLEVWDDNNNRTKVGPGEVAVKTGAPELTVSAEYLDFNPSGEGSRARLPIKQAGSSEDLWKGEIRGAGGKVVRSFEWKSSAPAGFSWDGRDGDGKLVPDGVYGYFIGAADRAGNRASARIDNIIVNTLPTPLDLAVSENQFSPNGDGVKDGIEFRPRLGVSLGVVGWTLGVLDASGAVRRAFEGKGAPPAAVLFDGKDSAGTLLPEGEYRGSLSVSYSNGNRPQTSSPPVRLRTNPPTAAVAVDFKVFSPGGEGGRSFVTFTQQSSEEESWTGVISGEAGGEVRRVSWRGRADVTFVWDGRGADGRLLPDGTYRYRLQTVDRAGNPGRSNEVSVAIDTKEKIVLLTTDPTWFSPLGAGAKNKLTLYTALKDPSGILSAECTISTLEGQPVRRFKSELKVPESFVWDGIDDQGRRRADGEYMAELAVVYQNGRTAVARSNQFFIKNTPPSVTLEPLVLEFSPIAESSKPAALIRQTTSDEDFWEGAVVSQSGAVVRGFSWKGRAGELRWDATDDQGNRVADGSYSYRIRTEDRAGNKAEALVEGLRVDTRPTPVFITVSADGFSPNGDGTRDSIEFRTRVGLAEGATGWKLALRHAGLGVRRAITGQGPAPERIIWDGINDLGNRADEGMYTAELSVDYSKGSRAEAVSTPFLLNSVSPRVVIGLEPLPFSPDNDGVNDELGIALAIEDPSPLVEWSLDLFDPAGHPFKSWTGRGTPAARLVWDGRSDKGELVQAASDYLLQFRTIDILGNRATARKTVPIDILVMRDGERLRIIIPSITFVANKPDFLNVEQEKVEKNIAVLKRLAEIFTRYGRYRIVIEGHANMVYYYDAAKARAEQDNELIPLSKARAESVKKFLASLGIDAGRISTEGIGGARPLIDFADLENNWKNRRVEFLLIKE